MSVNVRNYSKSIIYKLCCKDVDVKSIYIGSTTNVNSRKSGHKSACNNSNAIKHNYYVYQFIRENGGFDNWSMVEIEKVEALDKKDLEKRERYYIETLKAELNKMIPTRTTKEYHEDNKVILAEKQKVYCQENKESIAENKKVYYENNKTILSEKQKVYNQENKESIAENKKVYYENNKTVIVGKQKVYNQENKELITGYKKTWYQKNQESITAKQKAHYEKNKESINKKVTERIICKCGSSVQKGSLSRHKKSLKHVQNSTTTI